MCRNLTERIINRLIRKKIISEDVCEIYQYGLERLINTCLSLGIVFIIGACLGGLVETLVIIVAFMSLRMYAGGYHASTSFKCLLLTIFSIVTGLLAVRFIEFDVKYSILLMALLGMMCVGIIPVETPNKPLDKIECCVYKQKAIKIWLVEFICALVCAVIGWEMVSNSILAAHIILMISLFVGYISNKKVCEGENINSKGDLQNGK